ncbi:TetR/AcrR family transcriptional regulator [Streptomyces sp. NPDC052225]|uniref:TetR/AcrR family transcriptional regulator n=1 Tax=Streptomyces sp. NPDC052225 TaxID=3154949 RepID=UPI00344639C7
MENRPYHHGDLRAALLARAEQTLRERGAGALSLRELARETGVSPGAPSRHFASKQALFDALALTGFERLGRATTEALAGAGETFADRLTAAARAYTAFAAADGALLDLMYSSKHSPEASQALAEAAHRWVTQLEGLIEEGQKRGEVRQGPVARVALPAFTSLHGYTVMAAGGLLPPELTTDGLDDVIAGILRACAPEDA